MRIRKTLVTLLGGTALAALPVVAVAQDWDGFYGGVSLGYTFGDAQHRFSNAAPSGNASPDGVLFGAFAGYAFQSGNTVFGIEVDGDVNKASGSFTNTTGATSTGSTDGVWQASVRGVLGFAGQLGAMPALYYATGGWAVGEFDFRGGPAGGPTGGYSETVNGWTVGLGVDMRANANTAVRVEYRYTDFEEARGRLLPNYPGVAMPVDVDQHAVRIGVRLDF